ncbi:tRNA (guanine(10)-N(2))-dimethyltransferase [Candidatus Woesearchaeota archaeon]|nr:tRNA (guanine(10)-N(2))-dimethyltransferase [Candidatus Woesearchaeota archaeon]
MNIISEGKARIYAESGRISRKMEAFYNPAMKLNRDLSVQLLNAVGRRKMQIADPLAGTGVRCIRFGLELEKGLAERIAINDISRTAIASVRRNLKLNRISSRLASVSNKDANIFLLESKGFDYIDIDPFGSPAPFLDSATQRLARGGIIAVTATDTAALAGTSPGACMRKYWARPLRNQSMHETGLRILIRRVQLAGMQHEKALTPILSYHDQHYQRTVLSCRKGRIPAAAIYRQHGFITSCLKCLHAEATALPKGNCSECGSKAEIAGPLWLGQTSDARLCLRMSKHGHRELLTAIAAESKVKTPWIYNLNSLCRKSRIGKPPRIEAVIDRLRQAGHKAARTHMDWEAIRTEATVKEIVEAIKH